MNMVCTKEILEKTKYYGLNTRFLSILKKSLDINLIIQKDKSISRNAFQTCIHPKLMRLLIGLRIWIPGIESGERGYHSLLYLVEIKDLVYPKYYIVYKEKGMSTSKQNHCYKTECW